MNLDTSLAPGCYGMGMCYREGSAECGTCPFASSCGPLAQQQLAMLRAELGVVAPERKTIERPAKAAGPLMQDTNGLPKKVAAWIDRIERAGIKVTDALARGVNPFAGQTKGAKFLNVACHLLLKCPQGVSRDLLTQSFMRALDWQADTTASHVTQTRQILAAIGAIDEVDGIMKLRTP